MPTVDWIRDIHQRVFFDELTMNAGWLRKRPYDRVWFGPWAAVDPKDVATELEWWETELALGIARTREAGNPLPLVAETVARAHHEFVRIHPFNDGNGRSARLVADATAWQFGYLVNWDAVSLSVAGPVRDAYFDAMTPWFAQRDLEPGIAWFSARLLDPRGL